MKRLCNCGCGKYVTPEIRFWQKVKKTDSCWLWTATLDRDGYGKLAINRRCVRAHRFSYELHYRDKIPNDLHIDHICRIRNCVNPKHLRVVTARENALSSSCPAALNLNKDCCLMGHPLSGVNLYVQAKTKKRFCRECDRKRGREYYLRKKTTYNARLPK